VGLVGGGGLGWCGLVAGWVGGLFLVAGWLALEGTLSLHLLHTSPHLNTTQKPVTKWLKVTNSLSHTKAFLATTTTVTTTDLSTLDCMHFLVAFMNTAFWISFLTVSETQWHYI
jgi:thiosulfate reductase cytochrome b subunit